jgi:DNA polymerase-3 subunit gamma/tau
MRRQWPEILEAVKAISRLTWSGLQTAQLLDFDGRRVLLGKPDRWWVDKFMGTRHEETLKLAISEYLGLTVAVEAVSTGDDDDPSARTPTTPEQEPPREPPQERPQVGRLRTRPGTDPAPGATSGPASGPTAVPGRPAGPPPVADEPGAPGARPDVDGPRDPAPSVADQLGAVRGAAPSGPTPDWSDQRRSTAAPAWATGPSEPPPPGTAEAQGTRVGGDAPSADDEDLTSSGAVGQPVVEQVLGGTVIAINDDPVGREARR